MNYLSVVERKVAGLFWQNQIGWCDPYFSGDTYMFYTGGPAATLGLLGISVAGLMAFRRSGFRLKTIS